MIPIHIYFTLKKMVVKTHPDYQKGSFTNNHKLQFYHNNLHQLALNYIY